MRRAATVMIMLALVGPALLMSGAGSAAAGRVTSAARAPGSHRVARSGHLRVVRYAGYSVQVPASWPVYRLSPRSTQCVRYDRHAVYLGQPGADQQCPAHAAGRADTVSLSLSGGKPPWQGARWRPARAGALWSGAAGGAAYHGRAGTRLMWDARDRALAATFAPRGLAATATYGGGAGVVSRILSSVRWAGQPAASTTLRAYSASRAAVTNGVQVATTAASPAGRAWMSAASPPPDSPAHRIKGFDTCATPSLRVMQRWRHAFQAAAIYLGGPEAACPWGNLSPAWVQATTAMGWSLIPAYVGPQAPCTGFTVRIHPGRAERTGREAAQQAVALARQLGIGKGAPLYDDMESYDGSSGRCRNPVLAYLDGWTRELHALGYRSGVYASAGSAAGELGTDTTVYGHALAKPDSLWFALWNNRPNVSGRPYVRDTNWTWGHRIKQYRGGHDRDIRGVKLDIDSDMIAGAVYQHG